MKQPSAKRPRWSDILARPESTGTGTEPFDPSGLESDIAAERAARIAGDATQANRITVEIAAREAGDAELDARLDQIIPASQPEVDDGIEPVKYVTPVTLLGNSAKWRDYSISAGAPAWLEGRTFWDVNEHTLAYYADNADVTHNIGQEMWVRCRNNTGSAISDGTAVYISGALGNRPTIALANPASYTTSVVLGLATHNLSNNEDGYVTIAGLVNGLNTSAFGDGDVIYLGSTPGSLTNVRPVAPLIAVRVGTCVMSHVNHGRILVLPQEPSELQYRQVSSNTALQEGDKTVVATAACTITLPDVTVFHTGCPLSIIAEADNVILDGYLSQTIAGDLTFKLYAGEGLRLFGDGVSKWRAA